jgi:hypothetical protein
METDFVDDKPVETRYYEKGKLVKTEKDPPVTLYKSVERKK